VWCKEVSPVLPQLTVTPVQQMHTEWNKKWKQWLYLYHTWQKANKTGKRMNISQEITTKQNVIHILISSAFPSFPPCLCVCLTSLTSQTVPQFKHTVHDMHDTHTYTHHWKLKNISGLNNESLNPQAENIASTPHKWWQETFSKFSYYKSQLPHYTNSILLHCNSTAVVLMTFYSTCTGPCKSTTYTQNQY